jgi:hypothetical protein
MSWSRDASQDTLCDIYCSAGFKTKATESAGKLHEPLVQTNRANQVSLLCVPNLIQ